MCIECHIEDVYWVVCLKRSGPKNKGQDPVSWLEGHDIQEGYYEEVARNAQFSWSDDDYRTIVGFFYTEYYGAVRREYSQPMFTYKSAGECNACEQRNGLTDPDHFQRKWATPGCICGNIAYAARDCEAHPLPSVDSRWVRNNQDGNVFCNFCNVRLDQERWDRNALFYCDMTCREAYYEDRDKRNKAFQEKG